MGYKDKIKKFFNVNEISEDVMKIEKNGFKISITTVNNKLICKIGKFDSYATLYRALIKNYYEYIANELPKELKKICPDCEILYKNKTSPKLEIKYKNSYIYIKRNTIEIYFEKEIFKKFLEIQKKLYEMNIINI